MKLLVVKLNAIGDLVIATPAIRRLKEGLQGVRIDLLTSKWCAPSVEGNPNIDRLIEIENNLFFQPKAATAIPTFRLLNELRRAEYDAAVLFHRHKAVDLYIKLAGISRRFQFDSKDECKSVRLDETRHSALTAWELADLTVRELEGSVVKPPTLEELQYEWYVKTEELEISLELLSRESLTGDNYVVVFPGGGVNPNDKSLVKRWSVEKYVELIKKIVDEFKTKIVLLGGISDMETVSSVVEKSGGGVINLCGKTNLRISAAIAQNATIVVTNDSGPLHIAAAVGAPVVGIFGPTGMQHKLPPGRTSYAATLGLPCSPCYFSAFKGCIFDKIRCLEELTVDMVMKVIEKAIPRT